MLQRSPLVSSLILFFTGASRDVRRKRERARTSENRCHRVESREQRKKKGISQNESMVASSLFLSLSLLFFFYLEKRVQPFDLDHPPIAREVGPVAGGDVASGDPASEDPLPWRRSGGHRGKRRRRMNEKKRKR